MPTRLYLVRHAPTTAPSGSLVGSSDLSLSGSGLDRLQGVVPKVAEVKCWYCSPMVRTRQTMQELERCGCRPENVQYDERLREIDFGRWELQSFSDIAAADPELVQAWQRYEDFVFPQGEAVTAFTGRVREMLDFFNALPETTIGVMTHGGVIRTMICLALGLDAKNYLLFDVRPASLTVLDLFDQGGILRGLNL